MPVEQHQIFISYAREDASAAERLARDLKRSGVRVWIDSESLLPGQRWQDEIAGAIRESSHFIALLSSSSVQKRGYVQKEVRIALAELEKLPNNAIFLIPVRLDECSPTHDRLHDLHWVDLFPEYQKGFQRILRVLGVRHDEPQPGAAVEPVARDLSPSAVLARFRRKLLGESASFLGCLVQAVGLVLQPKEIALLVGEAGTGKDLIAQLVHECSPLSHAPWIGTSIASMSAGLVESELFGHEAGAFLGATRAHAGLLEQVQEGTLLMDEVGDLDAAMQAALLRLLDERSFRRRGSDHELLFRGRLICTTHRNLAQDVDAGKFDRDLYLRLCRQQILVPPLRERAGDVSILAQHFLERWSDKPPSLSRETLAILSSYSFPYNVRELENVVRSAQIQCGGDDILPRHLPIHAMDFRQTTFGPEPAPPSWLAGKYREEVGDLQRQFDRKYLPEVLKQAGYNVTKAAMLSGLDPKTFRKKWKESGLTLEDFRPESE